MNARVEIETVAQIAPPVHHTAFTAADYIAIERAVGHIVGTRERDGRLCICTNHVHARYTEQSRAAYIAGMWRFRAWQKVTPDWAEQVAAELEATDCQEHGQ